MHAADDTGPGTARIGILINNLGSPDEPTTPAVRRYLAEFLSDPRVIEAPRLLWWLVLHGVILRIRPARAARAYRKVWRADGSPLVAITRQQASALQQHLNDRLDTPVKVAFGMRYGKPSLQQGLQQLADAGAGHVLVLPLYPQYSATTTASSFDGIAQALQGWRRLPELRLINGYAEHPAYIKALADSIHRHWQEHGQAERLMFSFHGLPQRYDRAGDPYADQCRATAQRVADHLGLSEPQWQLCFQSRFGREEWLKPYTDHTLRAWGEAGIKSVEIICPGFAADCLETLEEIAEENRDVFLAAGGQSFHYIPALNAAPGHIEALGELIERHLQGWR